VTDYKQGRIKALAQGVPRQNFWVGQIPPFTSSPLVRSGFLKYNS